MEALTGVTALIVPLAVPATTVRVKSFESTPVTASLNVTRHVAVVASVFTAVGV